MASSPKIIRLNVGGYKYETTITTLRKYPNSMLGCMFGGKFTAPALNEDGELFIDANGEIFKYILDFLRREKLMLPEDFKEFDLLEGEADFFQIQLLIHEINLLKTKRIPKETKTLLCVWVHRWIDTESDPWEDKCFLHAAFIKCSGLFTKIVHEGPSHTDYTDLCKDLKNEGYNLETASKELSYESLSSLLLTHGVTTVPKYDSQDLCSGGVEQPCYGYEIYTKICDKPS